MRVIFAGGGTGGHIYPALSIIKKVKQKYKDSQVLFVGSDRGLEKKLMDENKISFISMDLQGLRRSLSLNNFKTAYKFICSLPQSRKIIQDFKPDVVVGTGGYVSAPLVYEASRLKIPTIVFEPNSYPGLANKWLGKKVDKIAIVNPEAAKYFPSEKVVITGNPRSQEVYEQSQLKEIKNDKENKLPTILIFGGSLGALKINEVTQHMIEEHQFQNFRVIFGTGDRYYRNNKKVLGELAKKENIVIKPYIDDMGELLSKVSLIVSRSGATTISELTALGVPSILIPSPNVTHDHQTYNAKSLSDSNAAILLPESDLSATKLYRMITELMVDKDRLNDMKKNSFSIGKRDAGDKFVNLMQELRDKNV